MCIGYVKLAEQLTALQEGSTESETTLLQTERALAQKAEKLEALQEAHDKLRKACEYRTGRNAWVHPYGGYCLALKNSRAYVGSEPLTFLVAGEEHQGSVQRKHTVVSFEHRAAAAKAIRSVGDYTCLEEHASVDAHEIKSDSTHDHAVQKKKSWWA